MPDAARSRTVQKLLSAVVLVFVFGAPLAWYGVA
jgi:hypothetical protein